LPSTASLQIRGPTSLRLQRTEGPSWVKGVTGPMRVSAERRLEMFEGMPARACRERAVALVSLYLADTGRLGEVEVLVANAPAWPPSSRAAPVVTDGGSLAAHAFHVAGQYGIPAVLALVRPTQPIRDGQSITLDPGAVPVERPG
jgi:phosphoenolpyruvate synthase/pyruvate phosphate dikinase